MDIPPSYFSFLPLPIKVDRVDQQ